MSVKTNPPQVPDPYGNGERNKELFPTIKTNREQLENNVVLKKGIDVSKYYKHIVKRF